jgi:hypothetical protein
MDSRTSFKRWTSRRVAAAVTLQKHWRARDARKAFANQIKNVVRAQVTTTTFPSRPLHKKSVFKLTFTNISVVKFFIETFFRF